MNQLSFYLKYSYSPPLRPLSGKLLGKTSNLSWYIILTPHLFLSKRATKYPNIYQPFRKKKIEICELEKSLEAILCFHQGFLIKYSSTLSRLSIVTVSSPARNYNIWSSPTSSHLPPPGEGGENEKMISFLSKPNCTHIEYINLLFFCRTDYTRYIWWIFYVLWNIFPRNILHL